MVIEIDVTKPISEHIKIRTGCVIITIKPIRRKRMSVKKD